ncbi:O-succinylbenzoate-CoA ligase [Thalassoporum mexicanum PCC 7367]|uniref:o-succinylbenzoate--CoA ligase n=1 Tax=Thalassoporum mexicanum TaxID=3457544 RepID=UPI00029FB0AA|nr:o-succinylbenzoate--CoA ligase [Pseudanabaena sp. PCC 7367]AFY71484.1 O-succinylbenzoate-CoA ligase [Pseudanabaena sp. PCC 7367]
MIVPDWLGQRVIQRGDRLALVFEQKEWTYAQLAEQVTELTGLLIKQGIKPGDYVAVLMANRSEYVFLIHALARIGAIAVFLNTRLSAVEISWQLGHSGSSWLIYDQLNKTTGTEAIVITSSQLDQDVNLKAIAIDSLNLTTKPDQNHDYESKSNPKNKNLKLKNTYALQHSNLLEHNANIDLKVVQAIVYTSGTTGKPKAVQLTYGNHFFSATAAAFNLGIEPDCDRWLVCLPLFHVGGLAIVWRSVIYGSALILQPKFEQEQVIEAIANQPITIVSLVPTMLKRIMANATFESSLSHWQKLRTILLGGAPVDKRLWQRCLELDLPIAPTYGLTEAASQVATLTPTEAKSKIGSAGRSLLCNQIRIIAIDAINPQEEISKQHSNFNSKPSYELPSGEIGQIQVRGTNVTIGYLNNSIRTFPSIQKAIDQSGSKHDQDWFSTGDLGCLDSEGFLYVVNRRHDLIISGGENIYPAEVEALLANHPLLKKFKEFCVIGTDCPEWGQQVTVAIVNDAGNDTKLEPSLTLETLREFCQTHNLARYKLPKAIAIISAMPRTASGKIDRQKLRELIEQKDRL